MFPYVTFNIVSNIVSLGLDWYVLSAHALQFTYDTKKDLAEKHIQNPLHTEQSGVVAGPQL